MTLRDFISMFTDTDGGICVQVGDEPVASRYMAPFDNWYSFASGHVELFDGYNDELLDHDVQRTYTHETERGPYGYSTYLVVTVEL